MKEQTFVVDSEFHRRYVGLGKNEVVVEERPALLPTEKMREPETVESVLKQYRKYVGDPTAELPQEILKQLGVK